MSHETNPTEFMVEPLIEKARRVQGLVDAALSQIAADEEVTREFVEDQTRWTINTPSAAKSLVDLD